MGRNCSSALNALRSRSCWKSAEPIREGTSSPRSGLRKVAEHLDAVAADVALVEDAGEENAEVPGGVLPAEQGGDVGIVRVGVLRVRVLQRPAEGERFQVERLASLDVDRAADAAFVEVRRGALVDREQADDLRRQQEVVEAAGGGQLLEHEPVGHRHVVAVHRGADEVGRHAPQRDAFAFAEFTIDDDARHALHRFGEVLVGQLADVLGDDGVDDRGGLALDLHGLAQGVRDADDGDLLGDGLHFVRGRVLVFELGRSTVPITRRTSTTTRRRAG